jgi:hypothetical protein
MDFLEPHSQTVEAISSKFLAWFEAEGETFVSWIVAADETCVHQFEPGMKRME